MKELEIADLFCGAGGTSTGAIEAALACGFSTRLTAVNHWPVAVETHTLNHPEARHFCTGVDELNPRALFAEGELDILWASPECTHHSIARGGRPVNEQSRSTAWCVTKWAEQVRPRMIFVENVPEFLSWGPLVKRLVKGKLQWAPDPKKKGAVFKAWVATLEALGYRVEWRILCAADFGDPTTRKRLFVQAVRGRLKVVWPEPSHSAAGAGRRWVAAREIIDWSLPSQSIYARKKPLSAKTMTRIYTGLQKFGLRAFVVPAKGEARGQVPRTHGLHNPLPTVTATGHLDLVEPYLVELRGTSPEQVRDSAVSLDAPISAVATSGAHHALVEPFIVNVANTKSSGRGPGVWSSSEPLRTVTTSGAFGVCEPALLPQQSDGRLRGVGEPVPTVATDGAIALVEPYLVEYYGNGGAASVDEPVPTVTTRDRFGLVMPEVLVEGRRYRLDLRFRMLQPHELAAAQGFRSDYKFAGNKTEVVKQVGNAVPRRLARALVAAALTQNGEGLEYGD